MYPSDKGCFYRDRSRSRDYGKGKGKKGKKGKCDWETFLARSWAEWCKHEDSWDAPRLEDLMVEKADAESKNFKIRQGPLWNLRRKKIATNGG